MPELIVCRTCQHDAFIGNRCQNCGNYTCPKCGGPLVHAKNVRGERKCYSCRIGYVEQLTVTNEAGTHLVPELYGS